MQGDGCLGSSDDSQTDSKDFSLSDTEGEYILFFLLCFVIFFVVLTSLKKTQKNTFLDGEIALPGASQFLVQRAQLRLVNPEPYLLHLARILEEATFLCFNHPKARYQATRDHCYNL